MRASAIETRARRGARFALLLLLGLSAALTGCAKRTHVADLSEAGSDVHVRLTTEAGDTLEGTLVSLDASELVAKIDYAVEGDVRLRGYGERAELFFGDEKAPGTLLAVEPTETGRVAVVLRSFPMREVVSATFHVDEAERSLGSVISMFLGPVVGGAAGFLF
jgi:hypothetical protein